MNGPAEARSGLPAPVSLALLVWLFGFFAFAGTTILGWHPVAQMAGVLLYAVPVVAWAVIAHRRSLDRLDLAVIGGVLAHLMVSFFSLDRQASMEMSALVAAYAATFWIARSILVDAALRRIVATAIVIAILFWLIVFAMTWIGEKVDYLQQLGWPPVLEAQHAWAWGSINTPPILLFLVAPFITWLPSPVLRRVAVGVWLAAALVVVPLSVGRAGWLGIGVAIASLEPLFGFRASRWIGHRVRSGGPPLVRAAWLIPAAALLVAAVALIGGAGAAASELDSRARLWQQAMSVFRADPLTGAGPSTFPWARLSHVPDYVDRVAAKDAHSIPFQTLADGGLVLAFAGLLVVAAWARAALARREGFDGRDRLAIAALVGYAAVGLLDDLGFLPAVTVLLLLLAAWVAPAPAATIHHRQGVMRRIAPAAVLLVVAAITAPSVASMTASRLKAAEGRQAALAHEWDAAATAFQRAAELHPESAQHWMSIGLAAGLGGRTETAVNAYEWARSRSPGDPRPWGALAALAANPAAEVSLLSEAARRSNDPRYAYRLGTALNQDGNSDAAARAFADAVVLEPNWFAAVPTNLWPAVREAIPQAISRIGPVAGRDPEEARWNAGLAFDDLSPDAPSQWQAVQRAANGDMVEAREFLSRAQAEEPNNPRTDEAARAVAWLDCDRAGYERADSRVGLHGIDVRAGDHPVIEGRAGLYRDVELGDYQPIAGHSVPDALPWPVGLIEEPSCGW